MDRVTFKINCEEHSVGGEVSSDVTLLDYIRNSAELRGTKYMCREAGCGACIVSAATCAGAPPLSVNSCMVSVTSCQDWEITTVERVGNKLDGYSVLQRTLAEYNGTQCGYCTPGWIMAMYSLVRSKKDLTMLEIEKSFGSNVCRCTGYRPILEAFKKFAKDSPGPKLPDIEDLQICSKTGKACAGKASGSDCDKDDWCFVTNDDVKQSITKIILKDGKKWLRVHFLFEIFNILYAEGLNSYMLVAGNTAKGAYPIEEYPRILIDISGVSELKGWTIDQNLVIGAGVTLTELLGIFQHVAQLDYFGYLQKFYAHLELVAHIPVRNIGTIGGNLMIKHEHNEFPSDIFLLLTTVGAQLTILSPSGVRQFVTMQDFLRTDMRGKIILNALIPPLSNDYHVLTYKIMPKAQNAHAIVNAGFLYKLDRRRNIVLESRIVYGGLSPTFTRATATEHCLIGRDLFRNETLQLGINTLKGELVVVENPPEPSAAYRKQLAINLFYKGLLSLCPANVLKARYKSGAVRLRESRPVSDARQIFDTNPSLWPLNKPVPKLEALVQCSGEAPFTEDLPAFPREVFAAFALSTVPTGTIVSIDPSRALHEHGVVAFYTAKDIPGLNSFTPIDSILNRANEEVLCSTEVKYYNQPIGIVVAETQMIADRAAKLVKATYKNVRKPVLDIKTAKKDSKRNTLLTSSTATDKGADIAKVIKGDHTIYEQYHFMMETLVCVTKPIEEGLEVHSATQWMDGVQLMIARALNMDQNRIDVHVRRLGGAYGMKISRSAQQAVACSLVASKLNRPCRFIQSLTTNMRAVGKRLPCSCDFEVAVNKSGVIQYINYDIYEDNGYNLNEILAMLGVEVYYNCYRSSRWNYRCFETITDNTKHSWCRSPGTLENIAMAETVMERISHEMSLDPIEVRLANLDETRFNELKEMSETLKTNSQYNERRAAVDKFNKENRWKKRGLRCSFLRWTPFGYQTFDITLSVYHGDGTVAITHCGIEMGQGVNTKAAQICAYFLKIPLEKIQIKANNTVIAPNGFISGGSITSQNVGIGVQRCCEELLRRLEPIRNQMKNATWEELIKNAFDMNVDLQTHGFTSAADVQVYNICGITLAEVEVDILTGEFEILRVDLLQDVGQSVSPEIDIGQVEGAFIMGLGYWTSEHLVYDPNTGEILTDRTWNYYVPQARDIPQDFRVYFRKKSFGNAAILGSKATGEPSICMAIAIPFAIREAIAAARLESGIPTTKWFQIVGGEVSSDLTLLDYIREKEELRGTKYMCREASCGACIVSAVMCVDTPPLSVNACMVSVTSCQDWEITTVERVGNKLDGYSVLQRTLAEYNGTQCGYCTPGWIMAMYSLMHCERDLTMLEIEKSFGSNVCRCTGYRPILEAFKKFAVDAPKPSEIPDIEDLNICKNTGKKCLKGNSCDKDDWCLVTDAQVNKINLKDGKKWYRVQFVTDIINIWNSEGVDSYMLVAGNTAKGAYPIFEYPPFLIDISGVSELKGWTIDQNLVIGAGVTLTELLGIFKHVAQSEYFEYLLKFYHHLTLVAHIPVRNIGTLAGNLMIKHQHREFPSDLFLLLTTVAAQLTLINRHGVQQTVTMEQFLTTNMTGMIILNVMLPPLSSEYKIVTFKIMPRAQNAHAIVNAGFLYKINEQTNTVLQSTMVFGGLSPFFVRARATEISLIGKDLFRNETLQSTVQSLKQELVVTKNYPPEPSAAYRKQLAISLFYKSLLELCPLSLMNARYKSGASRLRESRPVSDARQIFDTNPSLWPLNKPVQKLEALVQCSGEIPYTDDLPQMPREVFAAFVLSQVPSGNILVIDPHKALNYPGVIAFYTANDIPGDNNFMLARPPQYQNTEEVLCAGEIKYFNQPIGIIVAETREIAERAAQLVDVTYRNVRKPILNVEEAKKYPKRLELYTNNLATDRGAEVVKVIHGDHTIRGQYHYSMELLACVTKPTEQGLEVHSATQWLDSVHVMISRALKMEQSRIDVITRRIGGAYGIKVTRATQVAVACSLVTHKLNRPCRFIPPMTTTTRAIGKRFPCNFEFELGVNHSGLIQYITCNLFEDHGYKNTEQLATLGSGIYNNCYNDSRWNYTCYNAFTDNAKNTWCRSPSTLEHVTMAETIMEQISYELNIDPLEVRLTNLDYVKHKDIKELVTTLKTNADYVKRRAEVEKFNVDNRWKKRGLRFSFLRWDQNGQTQYDVTMSVYHGDGTVAITHSGIEMGQGVNTKAAQICAYFLKIPVGKITIKGNDTMITPNSGESVGSYTSQFSGLGVQRCCEELLKRLDPIRRTMANPTWEQLVQKAYESDVDLQVHSYVGMSDVQRYTVYGVTLAEVEIDVLTGEMQILRVDLLQDVGLSVSPELDIGQIEGAFIMGLGYWTSEQLVYEDTGELLTDRTWNYYVPQARDIPQDFRVYFRKKSYGNPAILGAKTTGEPSLCMAISIPFAIRAAISSARLESGISPTDWFQIDGPYTAESICLATKTDCNDFKLY